MKNTTENNKMIAEFMADKKVTAHHNMYHESWNELMPVVVKIKGMNIEDEEMFNEIDFYVTSSIENLYSAVVRFIEWYNNN